MGISRFRNPKERLEAYTAVSWVYKCINIIATSVAGAAFQALDQSGNPVDITHPFIELLRRPNPMQSGYDFIEAIQSYLELTGNAVVLLDQQNELGQPLEMYPLNPSIITFEHDDKQITAYIIDMGSDEPVILAPENVLHIKTFNPRNPFWGVSTIEAAAGTLDGLIAKEDYDRAFFKNGAKLSGIVSTDMPLDDSSFNRLKLQWQSTYSGVTNAHKTAILDSGLKYQPLAISQTDMQMLDHLKFDRDKILAIFGVSGVQLGLAEYANYKSDIVDRNYWKNTIEPRMRRLENALDALAQLFGLDSFEFKGVDTRSQLELAQIVHFVNGANFMTKNEMREMFGLEPIEGEDELPQSPGPTILPDDGQPNPDGIGADGQPIAAPSAIGNDGNAKPSDKPPDIQKAYSPVKRVKRWTRF